MVRTRTFDPASALASAVEVFAAKGYSDTSMEDIVEATGVSRYGLYSTFGNKRELFEQSLERFADNMGRRSFLRLLEPGASIEHIRSIFRDRVQDMCSVEENKGCLFIHTAMSLAPKDEELREALQKLMKRMSKAFSVGLESAKETGEVRADVDVRDAAEVLTCTMFGLGVLGRTGFDAATLNKIVDNTLASFGD